MSLSKKRSLKRLASLLATVSLVGIANLVISQVAVSSSTVGSATIAQRTINPNLPSSPKPRTINPNLPSSPKPRTIHPNLPSSPLFLYHNLTLADSEWSQTSPSMSNMLPRKIRHRDRRNGARCYCRAYYLSRHFSQLLLQEFNG